MVKAIKHKRSKKTTRDDIILVDFLMEQEDICLNLMTELVNKIYMSGDWLMDFLDATMDCITKQKSSKGMQHHRIISIIPYTGRNVART